MIFDLKAKTCWTPEKINTLCISATVADRCKFCAYIKLKTETLKLIFE